MVRRIIAAVVAVGMIGMCGGCRRKKNAVRVVEQIAVQWEDNGLPVCQIYEKPEKMQLILNGVRTLGQRFSADTDPEALNVSTVTMTLLYSDGEQQKYQIKPDRYVRIGQAAWQQASPRQVTSLRLLLLSLPSDFQT